MIEIERWRDRILPRKQQLYDTQINIHVCMY